MSGPSPEAVRVLHAEAQRYLDAVLSTIQDLDDKTSSLVRFNAVIVGVMATGISIGVRTLEPFPGLRLIVAVLAAGLSFMVLSTVEGVRSYLKPEIEVGIDAGELEAALELSVSEAKVREEAVRVYGAGIEQNVLVMEQTAARFRRMLYALIMGLVLLTGAALGLLLLGVD